MQPKRTTQDDHDKFSDKVFASMETGNVARARTLLVEYAAQYPEHAQRLRAAVIAEYGTAM